MVGYTINTKLRTITATFLAGIFTLSIFSQLTAYAAGNLFKIKTAEITEISSSAEGSITSYDDENIVSDIEFHQLNDEAKFKVILENTSAKDHLIETIEDDNTNPYIIYAYDNHAGETIAAGSELVFEFVAKYETQAAMDARAIASNVKFFIKYTEVEEPDEIELLVPNTGWGTVMGTESSRTVVRISTITTFFSGAALIVICVATIIRRKQSRNRRTVRSARRVAVVALALAAITVSATVRAINVEMSSFTLTTNYALKDRLQVTWTDAEGNDHEEIIGYNEPVNIPEQSKDGHTLTGWEDENGNPVDPAQPFTDDTKIHPVFRAHKYTIKFNGNGATSGEMENLEMTFGEAKILPANAFVWSGRTYTGWDTEANGSGAHYGDQDSVVDLTTEDNVIVNLYAQWSINPLHIDYDGNEATSGEMATTNCEYDQECILRKNAFARTGYDFKGWTYNGTDYADKADVTNIIENGTITMVAKWELYEYTITYLGLTDEEKAALHTQGNPDTYTILTPSFTLHNPEDRYDADGDKTQHFEGWRESTVSTTITLPQTDSLSNKIYEAIWSDVATPEYTVTYDYDGGDVATANKTKFTKFESFSLNEPVKEGYTFTGWTGTDVATETKPYTVPTGVRHDLEFTAHYRKNTYSVAFDINTDDVNISGSMSPMTGLEYGTDYNLAANAFARTGYTFGGWNTQADGQGNDYADQGEFNNLTAEDGGTATLYAKWNPTQYTIVFHANNENVENPDAMAPQVVTYDVETTLNSLEYTWWQHKLVEWTTNANGTGTKYTDKATIKNLNANGGEVHLYAKWREIDAALDGRGSMTNKGINTKLKAITTANPDAKNFLHYPNGEPSDEIKASATDLSGTIDPIYAWAEGENIYWWSEDVKPRISTNNSVEYHYYGVGKSTAEGKVNNLEYMDLTGFDTTGIVGARSPFEYTNIRRVDISDWDLSNATDMGYFAYNSQLTSIKFPEVFDVQKVTNVAMAFNGAKIVNLDLSSWKTRDLRNASSFINMSTVEEVKFSSDFSTANVTTMANMFAGSSKLSSLNLSMFDTANVQSMSGMFNGMSNITALDISNFDTGAVTSMDSMFANMTKLETLTVGSDFTATSVTGMSSIFASDTSLTSLDLSSWGATNSLTDLNRAFSGMTNLATLDLTGWDLSGVYNLDHTFHQTRNIETIYASSDTDPSKFTEGNLRWTFEYATAKIVGGAGSTGSHSINGIHSRIDDPDNGKPGYFTIKGARYIRYHDNDGNTANDKTNYALMKSHYLKAGEQLKANAFTRDGYVFAGWKDADNNDYTEEQVMAELVESKTPLELFAQWELKTLTITFDKNDEYAEGEMDTQTVTYTVTETLNANTFTNYQHTFLGWNTQADGKGTHYDNRAEIEITTPNDFTLYAEWKAELEAFNPGADLTSLSVDKANENVVVPEGTVCKRAIQLHEETCVSGQCVNMGYTETGSKGTSIVRYGSFGTQGTLASGDAFTCDVDGNGIFDEKLERFYYVSDYWNTRTREFEGDTAVLIYYRSVYQGQALTNGGEGGYSAKIDGVSDLFSAGPTGYRLNMPRTSLWRNVSLKNTSRQIVAYSKADGYSNEIEPLVYNDDNPTTVDDPETNLPEFSYEGYSARLLTVAETQAGCNISVVGNKTTGETDPCYYMYENSRFINGNDTNLGSIGVPFENPLITHNATQETTRNRRWGLHARTRTIQDFWRSDVVKPKPAIEVPKDKISY